ncbi:hypothetical protein CAPTEDRAFT_207974 [Capitella teleta]|uniref:Uncharacterized protein n=1 Tax=Capitella teleta TaxID=283909 RepID=R7TV28_CAPTE|nr:hypothetical protein CAPTEDRAFT_207974 [Capitella teleta]|eukprot:ELT97579.1 hypothetical protein CAPTEDRAFT_207974 [Capitella teleta]
MHELKTQMLELLSKMNMLSQTRTADQGDRELDSHTVPLATPPTFADSVRSTMKNTIKEEKAQAQVVISNAKEENSDLRFMSSLCEKISHKSILKNVSRMGTKLVHSVRPMVMTFDSNFDAHTFMSQFDDSKSDDDVSTLPIKIRPYRTREDQTMYKKKLEMARELNKKAKDESPNTSFSLRNNGCIWKYIKDAACNKWRRDPEWFFVKTVISEVIIVVTVSMAIRVIRVIMVIRDILVIRVIVVTMVIMVIRDILVIRVIVVIMVIIAIRVITVINVIMVFTEHIMLDLKSLI